MYNNVKNYVTKKSVVVYFAFALFFSCNAILHAHEATHSRVARLTHEIEKSPANTTLYLQRGEEYQSQSLWDKAELDFQTATKLEPDNKTLAYYRGSLFYASGRFVLAEKQLNDYMSYAADDARVQGLILRARILWQLNKVNQSYADYSQAILLSPQIDAPLYIERAELLIDHADQKNGAKYLALALTGLDEGGSRLGWLMSFAITSIDINLKQKNYDAALERIDTILTKISRKERWLVRRAEVLEQSGRFKEAKISYLSALSAIKKLSDRHSKLPAVITLKQKAITHVSQLE